MAMKQKKEKISVIIIDASAVTRYLLTEILEQSGDIEVVAAVHDYTEALNKIQNLRPHVITVDVTSPGTGGLKFIETLMELHPTPVVIVSALNHQKSDSVNKAIELGAVGYVAKKSSQTWSGILSIADEIVEKVRSASTVQVQGNISAGGQAPSDISKTQSAPL